MKKTVNIAVIGLGQIGNYLLNELKNKQKDIKLLTGKNIAIAGNQTSMINNTHLVDSLLSLKINVVKVFSPEHGFRGQADAGAKIEDGLDEKTGIPIISLYGKNKKPPINPIGLPNPNNNTQITVMKRNAKIVQKNFFL